MQWIIENWKSILLFGGFIGVHFFMHGRGGHGGHGRGRNKNSDTQGHSHEKNNAPLSDDEQPASDKSPRDDV